VKWRLEKRENCDESSKRLKKRRNALMKQIDKESREGKMKRKQKRDTFFEEASVISEGETKEEEDEGRSGWGDGDGYRSIWEDEPRDGDGDRDGDRW
jgi:hypothetical protein